MRFHRVVLIVPVADDERDPGDWDWDKLVKPPLPVIVEGADPVHPGVPEMLYEDLGNERAVGECKRLIEAMYPKEK